MTAASAPITPSQVLPGLIAGASLRLPKARPAKYAAISAVQTRPIAARRRPGEACNQVIACQNGISTSQPTKPSRIGSRDRHWLYSHGGTIANQNTAARPYTSLPATVYTN